MTRPAGGSPKPPQWFLNVLAAPRVTVQIGADRSVATAEITEGADRDRLWSRLIESNPALAGIEQKAGREIPVLTLVRRR